MLYEKIEMFQPIESISASEQMFRDIIAEELKFDTADYTGLDAAEAQEVATYRLDSIYALLREKFENMAKENSLPEDISAVTLKDLLLLASISDTVGVDHRYIKPKGGDDAIKQKTDQLWHLYDLLLQEQAAAQGE